MRRLGIHGDRGGPEPRNGLQEGVGFSRELVIRGSLERMTPVLMTALSAGVALAPLMFDAQAPGKEILHPVAITIFGGLVSATALDAFVTPALVLLFGRKSFERLVNDNQRQASIQPAASELEPVTF